MPINKCAKCDKTVYKAEEVRTCYFMCDRMWCIFVSIRHSFLSFSSFLFSTSLLPFLSYSSSTSTHPLPSHSIHHSSSPNHPSPLLITFTHATPYTGVLLRRCMAQELLHMRCSVWRWVQQSVGERQLSSALWCTILQGQYTLVIVIVAVVPIVAVSVYSIWCSCAWLWMCMRMYVRTRLHDYIVYNN